MQVLPSRHIRNTVAILIASVLMASNIGASLAADGKKILKWVDDKGVTHYGDSIPSQYADRDNSEINSQGITIRKNHIKPKEQTVLEIANQDQTRRDRALLASYTTEQEIDLARDRNLEMDVIAIDGLKQRRETVGKKLVDNQKLVDGFNTRKKPIPQFLSDNLQDNQAELTRIDLQMKSHQDNMDAVRQRFDNDKQRFINLKAATQQ
ncbi:MAG: DUF4124 domain-containing protein [Methylophilaceae bacterium]|nr:DUF4124 domain-containing protein [Methyloradius sp.]